MTTVLSLFLFVVAIVYVEYRLKTIRKNDGEEQQSALKHFASKNELKSQLKQLGDQTAEQLRQTNNRLTSIEQKLFFQKPASDSQKAAAATARPAVSSSSVFYFSWPDEDGSFPDSAKTTAQTEETYYELRLNDDGQTASYRFVTMSDTQLSKANNSSKKYIERACIYKGVKSMRYTCTPGTVRLQRGRWVVADKARIDYQ